MKRSALENRIRRLEILTRKNEQTMDITADVYQWFTDYCKKNKVKFVEDFEELDPAELTDNCIEDLIADYGWPDDTYENYGDQVLYDIQGFIEDAADVAEHGEDTEWRDWSDRSKALSKDQRDWLDVRADNDAYSDMVADKYTEARRRKLENRISRPRRLILNR